MSEVRTVNGVDGGLHSSRDWISLKTHQMTPPTTLKCTPSFEPAPKSIGQKNWTLQVRMQFIPFLEWQWDSIVIGIRYHA